MRGFRLIVTKRGLKGERAKAIYGIADYYYANRQRMTYDGYLVWRRSGSRRAISACTSAMKPSRKQ